MPTPPLLVFDTGVGGLSVLGEIRALLPNAPIVYVADSAGFPYGTKSPAEVAARVPALLGRLAERYDPLLIVIACNTASTIALDAVRAALDLPIVGTVPAIKPAAARSKTRAIGVLGTAATIVQPYVDRLAAEFAADCLVLRHGSHELVELAEAKLRGEPADPAAYARILDGLLAQPGGERDRHGRARLHPFPAGRGGARRRGAAAARLRRRQGGDRPPHRLADPRASLARRAGASGSPSSPGRSTAAAPLAEGLRRYGLVRIEALVRPASTSIGEQRPVADQRRAAGRRRAPGNGTRKVLRKRATATHLAEFLQP